MKTTYKSYSTDFKLKAISDKSIDCNTNSRYYWETKGKQKLMQANLASHEITLNDLFDQKYKELNSVFDELFSFFNELIVLTKKTKQLYKKSRNKIVFIWEKLKPFTSITNICKWFNISERTYFNWKNRIICKITPNKECPNIYPNQLRDWERKCLENEYFKNEKYVDYPISELLGQVMFDKKVIICESMFYEYARQLGETERRKHKRFIKKYISLKAYKPFEILHMDRTKIPIKNTNGIWLNLIADNYSRAILANIITMKSHSKHTLNNLILAINTHNLHATNFRLVTDDGSENKGDVKQFLITMPNITHEIAQKDIKQSNSMIEAINKQLKYRYFSKKEYDSINEFVEDCKLAIETYNNRPRKLHLGNTPLQVLTGCEVDLVEYQLLKIQTRQERIEENRNFNCMKTFY